MQGLLPSTNSGLTFGALVHSALPSWCWCDFCRCFWVRLSKPLVDVLVSVEIDKHFDYSPGCSSDSSAIETLNSKGYLHVQVLIACSMQLVLSSAEHVVVSSIPLCTESSLHWSLFEQDRCFLLESLPKSRSRWGRSCFALHREAGIWPCSSSSSQCLLPNSFSIPDSWQLTWLCCFSLHSSVELLAVSHTHLFVRWQRWGFSWL